MAEVDIKLQAIYQRKFLVESLQKELELKDEDIFYDDRVNGGLALYTLEKAFLLPMENKITHRLVLQDDMICCNNFRQVIFKIVNTHPNSVIGLFPYNFYYNEKDYYPLSSPYIKNNDIICNNGIIIPKQYIKPLFNWIHENYENQYNSLRSECILMTYFLRNGIEVINTIPSPVQHIGDDYGSYLPYPVIRNRKTSFFKKDCLIDINWDNKEILPFPNYDYSYKGKIRNFLLSGKGKFLDQNLRPRKEIL